MRSRIYINRHIIRANRCGHAMKPPITIRTYKGVRHAYSIRLSASSRVIYAPDKPLACGATVWIETEGEVVIDE